MEPGDAARRADFAPRTTAVSLALPLLAADVYGSARDRYVIFHPVLGTVPSCYARLAALAVALVTPLSRRFALLLAILALLECQALLAGETSYFPEMAGSWAIVAIALLFALKVGPVVFARRAPFIFRSPDPQCRGFREHSQQSGKGQ